MQEVVLEDLHDAKEARALQTKRKAKLLHQQYGLYKLYDFLNSGFGCDYRDAYPEVDFTALRVATLPEQYLRLLTKFHVGDKVQLVHLDDQVVEKFLPKFYALKET